MRFSRTGIAALVCGLGILAGALIVLLQSSQRLAGTDANYDGGPAIRINSGQQLCQPAEPIPADAGAIAVDIAGGGDARVHVSLTEAAVHAQGTLALGWRNGWVRIPLHPTTPRESGGTVCLRDLGPGPVAFGGSVPYGASVDYVDDRGLGGAIRIEYLRAGSETWLQLAPTIAHRITLAKSRWLRGWAVPAALLLMLLAVVLAVRLVTRERPA